MSLILLVIAFLLTGFVSISNKTLVEWHLGAHRSEYLLALYGSAMLLGFVSAAFQRKKSTANDMWVGLLMGVSGALSMLFLMVALSLAKGIVVFPIRSLGNLVVTALVSIIAWRERLSRSQWIGLVISLVAIWLLY